MAAHSVPSHCPYLAPPSPSRAQSRQSGLNPSHSTKPSPITRAEVFRYPRPGSTKAECPPLHGLRCKPALAQNMQDDGRLQRFLAGLVRYFLSPGLGALGIVEKRLRKITPDAPWILSGFYSCQSDFCTRCLLFIVFPQLMPTSV